MLKVPGTLRNWLLSTFILDFILIPCFIVFRIVNIPIITLSVVFSYCSITLFLTEKCPHDSIQDVPNYMWIPVLPFVILTVRFSPCIVVKVSFWDSPAVKYVPEIMWFSITPLTNEIISKKCEIWPLLFNGLVYDA